MVSFYCLLLCLQGFESTVQQPEYDWQLLNQGEILVEKIKDENGLPGIRTMFTIRATNEVLWGVLTDYDNFNNIYGGIDSLHVLTEDESGARVEIYQTVLIKKIQFVLQRNYTAPGYRLTWERVSGDMKIIKGSWDILDASDEGTKLVIFTSFFKYGGIVPTRLTRNWAMKEIHTMAQNARIWVEENRDLYTR